MRNIVPVVLEKGRVRSGFAASDTSCGLSGAFFVDGPCNASLKIISSTAAFSESLGWEHVSVSCRNRCPNWPEMSFVKDLFWQDEETVIQFHPAKSEYVNCHPYCLHLWRLVGEEIELPPALLIGPKQEIAS